MASKDMASKDMASPTHTRTTHTNLSKTATTTVRLKTHTTVSEPLRSMKDLTRHVSDKTDEQAQDRTWRCNPWPMENQIPSSTLTTNTMALTALLLRLPTLMPSSMTVEMSVVPLTIWNHNCNNYNARNEASCPAPARQTLTLTPWAQRSCPGIVLWQTE